MKFTTLMALLLTALASAHGQNLRQVDGKLYDADQSTNWMDLPPMQIISTNEGGAVVEIPVPTLWDGQATDLRELRAALIEFKGKILSVTSSGCVIHGSLETDNSLAKDLTFFVEGRKGYDGDSASGKAIFIGDYDYVATSGAAKKVRRLKLVVDVEKKIVIRNLRRPPGSYLGTLRVMKIQEGVYDCGIPKEPQRATDKK
jgi:hypothetical protein